MTEVFLYVTEESFRQEAFHGNSRPVELWMQVVTRFMATIDGACTNDRSEIHINLGEIRFNQDRERWFGRFEHESVEERVLYTLEHEALHAGIEEEDVKSAKKRRHGVLGRLAGKPNEENLLDAAQKGTGKWSFVYLRRSPVKKLEDDIRGLPGRVTDYILN